LSGRGLCDELITRPEESYRLCCVVVCDLETSRMGAPYIYDISSLKVNNLTLILLTWRKWWAPNNASKLQMGFNSGFKGLSSSVTPTDRPPGIVPRIPRTVRTKLQCAAVTVSLATVPPGELVSVCFLITKLSVSNIVLRRWYMTGYTTCKSLVEWYRKGKTAWKFILEFPVWKNCWETLSTK